MRLGRVPVNDMPYRPANIEPKWQAYWEGRKTFAVREDPGKRKFYLLDMFPYPSAAGLHVGHPEGYTATDILARYKRMRGFNVLHPMGWDAFGLPAENYAIKTGTHPAVTTRNNVVTFRRQIKALGFSPPSFTTGTGEIDTTDPAYYRWTPVDLPPTLPEGATRTTRALGAADQLVRVLPGPAWPTEEVDRRVGLRPLPADRSSSATSASGACASPALRRPPAG